MMKIITVLILGGIALFTRREDDRSGFRRYTGFVLVGIGAFSWSVAFDWLVSGRSVVTDSVLYAHILVLSTVGVLLSIAGLVASFWCKQKLLRIATVLIGAAAAIMCGVNIIVPY